MSYPTRKLGEIGQFRNGLNYSKENFGTGLKVISVKDFGDRWRPDLSILDEINPAGMRISDADLRRGDIIFVRSNGNKELIGRSMLIEDDLQDVSFSGFCIRFRPNNPETNSRFLSLFFRTSLFRRVLSQEGKGTNINNLNQSILERMVVPFPLQRLQNKITDIASAYDDLIENNRRRIALLEEAARMLYREWFVHFRFPGHEHVKIIDGLPEGWELLTFSDVCETLGGGTPKTEKSEYWNDGDIPWYTPTDITRNSCLALLESATKITEAGLRGSSAKMLPPATVLMTSRASVGFFGILGAPSCTNQGFISIIPHNSSARMYLLHNLMHRVEEIRSHAGGATYKENSKGQFRALKVLIPAAPLLSEFEHQVTTLHAQARSLHTMNQRLAHARDLLLPRLMNGEIAV